jgi:hypothetical protein
MLIQNKGTYRGPILDHGVGKSSTGLPQWSVQVAATEQYNYDTGAWEPLPEPAEFTGYLSLVTKKSEPTFHVADIQAAIDWDGKSLTSLSRMDLNGAGVQFNVEPHEYEGNTSLRMNKIAHYDATPSNGTIRKVDDASLRDLDAAFAGLFKTSAVKPTAAPAPASAKKDKVAAKKAKADAAAAEVTAAFDKPTPAKSKPGITAEEAEAHLASILPDPDDADMAAAGDPEIGNDDADPAVEAVKANAQSTPSIPAKPKAPAIPAMPARPKASAKVPSMTMDEAWAHCVNSKGKNVTDKQLGDGWLKAVGRRNKDEEQFTNEDWGLVAQEVVAEYGIVRK